MEARKRALPRFHSSLLGLRHRHYVGVQRDWSKVPRFPLRKLYGKINGFAEYSAVTGTREWPRACVSLFEMGSLTSVGYEQNKVKDAKRRFGRPPIAPVLVAALGQHEPELSFLHSSLYISPCYTPQSHNLHLPLLRFRLFVSG